MAKNNEEDGSITSDVADRIKNFAKKKFRKVLIIAIIIVCAIVMLCVSIKKVKFNNVNNSNDSNDSLYRTYGPGAYSDSISIAENGTITSEITAQEMWENDSRYKEYLSSVEELEYLLNAQFVTQYPYIESAGEDSLNGTIRFYRNNSSTPMVYVTQSQLQSYINRYNSGETSVLTTALNSFSINEDGTIKIVYLTQNTYSVTTNDPDAVETAIEKIEGSTVSSLNDNTVVSKTENILNTTNISYINRVQNYVLPFNFLWTIVVMGNSASNVEDLAHEIAELAYNGEISLIIDDNNVVKEKTDTYTYKQTEHYDGTIEVDVIERASWIDEKENQHIKSANVFQDSKTITDYKIDRNEFTTVYYEKHNNNTPSLKIKKIESWCAIFENDASYSSMPSSDADNPNTSTLDDTEKEKVAELSVEQAVQVPVADLATWKNNIDNSYTEHIEDDNETGISKEITYNIIYNGSITETVNLTNINLSSVSSTITSGYTNGTVNSPVFNEALVEIFNKPEYRSVRSSCICDAADDSWFIQALAVNDDTANMVDLVKYIINKVNGEDTDESFESIWYNSYSSYNSLYGGTSGISGNIGIIFDYLLNKGISAQGAAGIIGNWKQESGCQPNNLQNGSNIKSSISDETFTQMVNSGSITKEEFISSTRFGLNKQNLYGYGLAQWTSSGRKEGLYDFALEYDDEFDISDIYMQLDYFWKEFTSPSYQSVYDAVKDATDVRNATIQFFHDFEGIDDGTGEIRAGYAEEVYNEYLQNCSLSNLDDVIKEAANPKVVENAERIHKYVRENGYKYAQLGIAVPNYTGSTIDCSSYVTWVLVESGVSGFYSGMNQWDSVRFRSNPYGWQEVSVNDARPGDILCYNGHVEIVASNLRSFSCGSDTQIRSTGTSDLPETVGRLGNTILKVLRVPTN